MEILHKIDDFLYELFPKAKAAGNNLDVLKDEISNYYSYGTFKPLVEVSNGWIKVQVDSPTILSQGSDFAKAVALCEKGKYTEAKGILDQLILKNPTNSEYHRIYGQILSDEGNQDEAINHLIDALRWDAKNGWALLMMGNIFARHKNDIITAMKYFDQSLKVNPTDNITINNIGATLMQQGKNKEARKYFEEALSIDSNYPNTHFGLSMVSESEGDLQSAFYSAIQAIKVNTKKDVLLQNSTQQAFSVAKQVIETGIGKKILSEYLHKLEFEGGTEVEMLPDNEIPTAAKLELAENYDRPKHVVRYKPNYPAGEHLQMHELVHLDFIIEARKEKLNLLFISTKEHKTSFIRGIESTIKRLKKLGVEESAIADYCSSLFEGFNRQIFNAPIDLFIENFLYNEFAELRPYQFVSLYGLVHEGLKAVTDKKTVDLSPKDVLSKSKIYNIVTAIQFKELYGIDLVRDFNATPSELKQANDFYSEYLEYRDDRQSAEEYELVLNWAEDLKLEKNFEMVNESEYRNKRTNIDGLLESIEKDPYDIGSKDPYKDRDMEKFQTSQAAMGVNMAVVMYMVGALEHFDGMAKDKIKKVAMEIAMIGTQGIRPDKNGYRVSSIPGKEFTGYHLLAYYYVSWKLAIPEMLSQLHLPYDGEFNMAATMYKQKNNE